MTSTTSSVDDHAYFQAIEERFIRLRGAPLLLSPADWQLAKQWHEAGIPLALVLETLEQVFARRAERGQARGRVQGLRYCAPAIEAAWKSQTELQATGNRETRPPIDVSGRLVALSRTVRGLPFEASEIADEIASLNGTPDGVETSLVGLDKALLVVAERSLDATALESIGQSVSQSLARVRSRLAEEEVEKVRRRLFREAVRRHLDLPVLSLFEDRI